MISLEIVLLLAFITLIGAIIILVDTVLKLSAENDRLKLMLGGKFNESNS